MVNRTSLTSVIQGLPMPVDWNASQQELVWLGKCICGWSDSEALNYAAGCQKPSKASDSSHLLSDGGLVFTCPYHWRVDAASLWRGPSDPQKVCGIARSLLCSGYDQSEPICARDHDVMPYALRFGDGQKRGLAWRLAWCLLKKVCDNLQAQARDYPNLRKIFLSLARVPTVFPSEADARDAKATLIQQALRQNTKAIMQLPLNTIEWARLIIATSSPNADAQPQDALAAVSPEARINIGKKLVHLMNSFVSGYQAKLEESAVEMAPAAKRARRGRRLPPCAPHPGGRQHLYSERTPPRHRRRKPYRRNPAE